MKKLIISTSLSISLLSVMAQEFNEKVNCGSFYSKSVVYEIHHFHIFKFTNYHLLKLYSDSTFQFETGSLNLGYPEECKGKWEVKDEMYIYLECRKIESMLNSMTIGYMDKREHQLEIINKNKLRYGDVVLKRKKDKK